jgi:hypothetical protein
VNCNQELCIELWSVINFHREIEPANLLQYFLYSGEEFTITKPQAYLLVFIICHNIYCEPGSSVSIVSGYGLDDQAIEVRSPAGERIFPLASVSRPALGPTQPPVQWVPGVLSPGLKCGRGVKLTTHVVPRSRMSKSYTSSPHKRLRGV